MVGRRLAMVLKGVERVADRHLHRVPLGVVLTVPGNNLDSPHGSKCILPPAAATKHAAARRNSRRNQLWRVLTFLNAQVQHCFHWG